MLRKVSSFFPAVSKEQHVSLSKVESVREMKKTKALAATKEVSENGKKAMILENYNRSNQLRKQRQLEDIYLSIFLRDVLTLCKHVTL